MDIRFGSDIVHIPKFAKAFRENRDYFLREVFDPEEQGNFSSVHLAGVFAAKEAVVKALDCGPGRWREIKIAHKASGKPFIAAFPQGAGAAKKWKNALSISHDGDYAIANAVFYKS